MEKRQLENKVAVRRSRSLNCSTARDEETRSENTISDFFQHIDKCRDCRNAENSLQMCQDGIKFRQLAVASV